MASDPEDTPETGAAHTAPDEQHKAREQEDTNMKNPEYKRTLNPFRKEFWEAGHEPGDEILPRLKWLAILTAITVIVGIFGILMGW